MTKNNTSTWSSVVASLLTYVMVVLGIVYLFAKGTGYVSAKGGLQVVDVTLLGILLVISSGVLPRIEKFVLSGKGVEFQLQHLTERQEEQEFLIQSVLHLVNTQLPWVEYAHLLGLEKENFPFTKSPFFEQELRNLRSRGLIAPYPGVSVAGLPTEGDLKHYFHITDAGKMYVDLRRKVEGMPTTPPLPRVAASKT